MSIFTKILFLVTFRNKYIPVLHGGNCLFAHSLSTIKKSFGMKCIGSAKEKKQSIKIN